jgi:hypothetical protein
MLAQRKNRWRENPQIGVPGRFARPPTTPFAKLGMIHEQFSDTMKPRKRKKSVGPKTRLIGTREILLVLIAFALLAVVPSVAQISPFGRANEAALATKLKWDAELPAENFPGSAF